MKKLAFATIFPLVLGISGMALAGVVNSKHDMNQQSGVATFTPSQVCAYCHSPHNTTGADPLWAKAVGSGYTMYDSTKLDMTIGSVPGGVSIACLSCHDGTLAIDAAAGGTTKFLTGDKNLGKDLSNDHPIAVTYDPSAGPSGEFDTLANAKLGGMEFYGSGADQLECGTCHDPHEFGTGGFQPFLRADNTGSGLCLECHIK